LTARVVEKVSDGRVVDLIEGYVRQDVMELRQHGRPTAGVDPCARRACKLSMDKVRAQTGRTRGDVWIGS
jgi:hypothetical protein